MFTTRWRSPAAILSASGDAKSEPSGNSSTKLGNGLELGLGLGVWQAARDASARTVAARMGLRKFMVAMVAVVVAVVLEML